MGRRKLGICVALVFTGLTATAAAEDSLSALPPFKVALNVCTPEFQTTRGELAAGTAFVVRLKVKGEDARVLVTAHHLFGPNGGLDAQVGWKELPQVVRSVRCAQLLGGKTVFEAEAPLAVEGACPSMEECPARDVAVFRLRDAKADGLEMKVKRPKRKQRVWLAARVAGGAPAAKLFHAARIVSIEGAWIEFEYDNPKLDLRATSGAPIVDVDGRIVGINVGVITKGKKLFGMAQSARSVQVAVEKALAASAR